jgi:hypothetical protein
MNCIFYTPVMEVSPFLASLFELLTNGFKDSNDFVANFTLGFADNSTQLVQCESAYQLWTRRGLTQSSPSVRS